MSAGIKNCDIQMVMKQTVDTESIKDNFSYEGRFASKDGSFMLKYIETLEEESNEVTIKYAYGLMTMKKQGRFSSEMVFDPNQTTFSEYMTPAGTLNLEIDTKSLRVETEDRETTVYAKYELKTQGQTIATNELRINIFMKV